MTNAISDSFFMTQRHVRGLIRQPWYIAFTLIQPIVYLLLFGSLFERVTQLDGFGVSDYVTFLTPGVIVMTAVFSAGWNGMTMIEDLDRGIVARFLVTPVSRSALIAGRIAQLAATVAVQGLVLFGLGVLLGGSYANGVVGLVVMLVCAALLAVPFAALSNALALTVRQEESVIGAVQFVVLPLSFTSSVFMAERLMPGWMQAFASFNPLHWASEAARAALLAGTDWSFVMTRLGALALFGLICGWVATNAFGAYQRSI